MVRRRGHAVLALGAVVGALAMAAFAARAVTPTPAEGVRADGEQPLLIKHGWDAPYPSWVRDNAQVMEQNGFDGVVVSIGDLGGAVHSSTPVSYEALAAELAPLAEAGLTTMTHNFVIVYAGMYDTAPGIGSDNPTLLANYANLARAAHEVGLEGIVIDNEAYGGPTWKWPEAAPELSFEEASAQAFAQGRQIMEAMMGQWPAITVMPFMGPWLSDPATFDLFDDHFPINDVSWANQLTGPWVAGMIDGTVGTAATLVDGGELYAARTAEHFQVVYDWLKRGVAEQGTAAPSTVGPAGYSETVSVAFGIYDTAFPDQDMNVAIWQDTVAAALARTDRYVWAYTEAHNWWGGDSSLEPVPQEWVDATVAAQAQVDAAAG